MALDQTQVSQLYVAIFNRASEGEGNTFWQTQPDMSSAAAAMLDTGDARAYFGASLDTNQAFIEHIYQNTLNKTIADDAGGIAFWTGLLDAGQTRGAVVAELVGVIENYKPGGPSYDPDDAVTIAAYNQFANRVTVSNYMADTVFDTPSDYATSTAFDKEMPVTQDAATVAAARARIDGFGDDSGTKTRVSIDNGTLETPVVFDAAQDPFNFTDDADVLTSVRIDNFTSDDRITITNAQASDYSFANDGTDVRITFNNNQGTVNDINLIGVVSSEDLVHDLASFTAAIGFDVFTG
ncbi:MAG: DUF4214 domain-containing protein [Desulfotignum sp.]|jgi:hypothetical protein|nr:DUF4214 domain-containing protein [Desulfotignum sp.]